MKNPDHSGRWLFLICLLALVLRLLFVLPADLPDIGKGGDTNWLLYTGNALVRGTIEEPPQVGPVYLVYTGLVQTAFGEMIRIPPGDNIVERFRAREIVPSASWPILGILNALMGTALCAFAFLIGTRWFSPRVGLLAALLIAVNPIFIIETGNLLTESPFLFLLFGALALYGLTVQDDTTHPSLWRLAAIGVLLALATMTRAVTLLLPAVLLVHLVWRYPRQALRLCAALLVAYLLTLSTWTVYNLFRWNRLVIGADGIVANIYLGTRPDGWVGPQQIDQQLGITGNGDNQQKYAQAAASSIFGDPVGYVRRRLTNLAESILQPHNTVYYPGASIKDIAAKWWSNGHALSEIGAILGSENFWPKVALYLFHFGALLFGLIGTVIGLRRLGERLPLYGMLGYFLALHLALTAIPRYLLPVEPLWIIFAASVLVRVARPRQGASVTG